MAKPIPRKLGRYEVLEELGKGAMGVVFLAKDPLIGRLLALKTFRLTMALDDSEAEQFRVRFMREAQSCGILNHPNIVIIHDVVEPTADTAGFIAMEYVRGTNLKVLMNKTQRFELGFILEVLEQVASALDYAHGKGVVHRDVKPANLLLTEADNRVKIADFGIALLNTSNLTQDGQLLGTPNYMAPEQIRGTDIDHRADLFALGVVLYEMLTRHKPFQGEHLTMVTHRIVYDRFEDPSQYIGQVPKPLMGVLERALAKDPADRYPTATAMVDDLRRLLEPEIKDASRAVDPALNQTQSLLNSTLAASPMGRTELLESSGVREASATDIAAGAPSLSGTGAGGDASGTGATGDATTPPPLPPVPSAHAEDSASVDSLLPDLDELDPPTPVLPPVPPSAERSESLPMRGGKSGREADGAAKPSKVAKPPKAPKAPKAQATTPKASAPAAAGAGAPRRRGLWIAAAALTLVMAATFAFLLLRGDGGAGDGGSQEQKQWSGTAALLMMQGESLVEADPGSAVATFDEVRQLAAERRAELAQARDRLLSEGDTEGAALRARQLEAVEETLQESEERLREARWNRETEQLEEVRRDSLERERRRAEDALEAGDLAAALTSAAAALSFDPSDERTRSLLTQAEELYAEGRREARRPPPPAPRVVEPEPEPVQVAEVVPPPPPPEPPTATLDVVFNSELEKGVLMIYRGEEQLLRESFRFDDGGGLFSRNKKVDGKKTFTFTVPKGASEFKVYVSGAPNRPTDVAAFTANFPGGTRRVMQIDVNEDGDVLTEMR